MMPQIGDSTISKARRDTQPGDGCHYCGKQILKGQLYVHWTWVEDDMHRVKTHPVCNAVWGDESNCCDGIHHGDGLGTLEEMMRHEPKKYRDLKVVADAGAVATVAHRRQYRKVAIGTPQIKYIEHPRAVAFALKKAGHDADIQAIGWLHDVIEDTKLGAAELSAIFPRRVVLGVVAMSRIDDETRRDYIERVRANPDAVIVKNADLDHNMMNCESVMPGATQMYQKDRDRLNA